MIKEHIKMRDYTETEYLSNGILKVRVRKLKRTNNRTNKHFKTKHNKHLERVRYGQARS